MITEITIKELREDYDWSEVFGEGGGGNCSQDVESLDGTSTDVCMRSDVAEIIGAVNGVNDGDEWVGVFRMADGRYLSAVGACDYTGWDCRAANTLTVASTLERLLETGLTPDQKERLGV